MRKSTYSESAFSHWTPESGRPVLSNTLPWEIEAVSVFKKLLFWPCDPVGKCRHLGDRDNIYQLLPCIIHIDTLPGCVSCFLCVDVGVGVCVQAGLIFYIYLFIFNVFPRQTPTQTQSHKLVLPFVSPVQIRAKSADATESLEKKLLAPPGRLNKRGFIRNKGK